MSRISKKEWDKRKGSKKINRAAMGLWNRCVHSNKMHVERVPYIPAVPAELPAEFNESVHCLELVVSHYGTRKDYSEWVQLKELRERVTKIDWASMRDKRKR